MTDHDDQPDVTPRDAVQLAQRALQKANRVDDLEAELEAIQDDVTALKLRVSELDDERDYRDLTLDEKIGMVREHAFNRARNGHGTASLDYNDVMWEVFDGEPGADHCYKLMRKAAECRGFDYRDPASRSKHLYVDARQARKALAFSSENKTVQEGGRSG